MVDATITPEELAKWLDEKKEFTLLDTRNDYEVAYGTFEQAVNLNIQHFVEIKDKINEIKRDKPIVMFCTGGIRCEKAALYFLEQGYESVYQLKGGILGYFAKMGNKHYNGSCFVFDERGTITA